jgi:hypothetical protein
MKCINCASHIRVAVYDVTGQNENCMPCYLKKTVMTITESMVEEEQKLAKKNEHIAKLTASQLKGETKKEIIKMFLTSRENLMKLSGDRAVEIIRLSKLLEQAGEEESNLLDEVTKLHAQADSRDKTITELHELLDMHKADNKQLCDVIGELRAGDEVEKCAEPADFNSPVAYGETYDTGVDKPQNEDGPVLVKPLTLVDLHCAIGAFASTFKRLPTTLYVNPVQYDLMEDLRKGYESALHIDIERGEFPGMNTHTIVATTPLLPVTEGDNEVIHLQSPGRAEYMFTWARHLAKRG